MIFCTYCKAARNADQAACPHCGAPSPLQGAQNMQNWGENAPGANSWNGPQPPTPPRAPSPPAATWGTVQPPLPTQYGIRDASWQGPSDHLSQQHVPERLDPFAAHQADRQKEGGFQEPSLLPVPYQNGAQIQPPHTTTLHLVDPNMIGQILPESFEADEPVYVAPIYKKPRPVTPRYRVVSGLISFVVVCLLLCTGASYVAKATGKLDAIGQFITGAPPASLQMPPLTNLPDPQDQPDKGPAYNIVKSATTTARLNKDNIAIAPEKVFHPNEAIYVTYTVKPPEQGRITIDWYENGRIFTPPVGDVVSPQNNVAHYGFTAIKYTEPAEGAVAIYWNDQLAQKMYFVVRP